MNEKANQDKYDKGDKTMMKSRLHVISSIAALPALLWQLDLPTCLCNPPQCIRRTL